MLLSRLAIHVIKTKEITIMKKSIVALLISAGVLTGCAQNNATETATEVAETSTEKVDEALGTAVDLNGNINYIEDKVSGDIWYDEG